MWHVAKEKYQLHLMVGSVVAQGAVWGSDVEDKMGRLRNQMRTDGKSV